MIAEKVFSRKSIGEFIARYGIYFFPIVFLIYLTLESYQIDFRCFYLAGKSLIDRLDPYINYVGINPQYYGPVNSEIAPTSGWKYPPTSAFFFVPYALLPYTTAKLVFNLTSIFSILVTAYLFLNKQFLDRQKTNYGGEIILFLLMSFPVIGIMERGQVDSIVVLITLWSYLLFTQKKTIQSAIFLALAGIIKIFPLALLIYFLVKKQWKYVLTVLSVEGILFFAPFFLLGPTVYWHFLQRTLPSVFGEVSGLGNISLNGQGLIEDKLARTIDSPILTITHDFTNGFMNPLLQSNPAGAIAAGLMTLLIILYATRKNSHQYQFFAVLNSINLFNPLAWIMGLAWYIPTFLFLYPKSNQLGRLFLLLPLFLPPFLNTNAIFGCVIPILFACTSISQKLSKALLSEPQTQL